MLAFCCWIARNKLNAEMLTKLTFDSTLVRHGCVARDFVLCVGVSSKWVCCLGSKRVSMQRDEVGLSKGE